MPPLQNEINPELLTATDTGVTITFAGMVFFKRNDQKQCLAHLLPFGNHRLMIDVQEITFDPDTGVPTQATKRGLKLDPTGNILIRGVKQKANGAPLWVTLFLNGQNVLDKMDPQTDKRDFRWTLNLYRPEFGRQPQARPDLERRMQTVYITNGVMYTEKLTDEIFASESLNNNNSRTPIGRVAYRVGVDIKLEKGDAVCLSNYALRAEGQQQNREAQGGELRLEFKEGTRYQVTIENLCAPPFPPPPMASRSDFHAYFEQVLTGSKEKFDLVRLVEKRPWDSPDLGEVISDGIRNFFLDSGGQICVTADGEDPPP